MNAPKRYSAGAKAGRALREHALAERGHVDPLQLLTQGAARVRIGHPGRFLDSRISVRDTHWKVTLWAEIEGQRANVELAICLGLIFWFDHVGYAPEHDVTRGRTKTHTNHQGADLQFATEFAAHLLHDAATIGVAPENLRAAYERSTPASERIVQ